MIKVKTKTCKRTVQLSPVFVKDFECLQLIYLYHAEQIPTISKSITIQYNPLQFIVTKCDSKVNDKNLNKHCTDLNQSLITI